jgi:glycogen debranching enzyme
MARDPLVTEAAQRSRSLLRRAVQPYGFNASVSEEHYSLWTRDMAFLALGANATDDPTLHDAVRASLLTLQGMTMNNGAMANMAMPPDYWDWGECGTTDASCLYTIAAAQHLATFPDPKLRAKLWPTLRRLDEWLQAQDTSGFGLITSHNDHDWMESSFNRGGKVLYVNALYLRHVRAMYELAPDPKAAADYLRRHETLRQKFNDFFWPHEGFEYGELLRGSSHYPPREGPIRFGHSASQLAYRAAIRPDRGHYISHMNFGQFVDECDVLGNVLAVLFDLATPERGKLIMQYMLDAHANTPHPSRTYLRPMEAGDPANMYHPEQEVHQDPRWRTPPGTYHHGAAWPFIGGLFSLAEHHVGRTREAATTLHDVAGALRLGRTTEWEFPEWIGLDGTPSEIHDQTWNAGTYLAAHARIVEDRPVHL